MNYNEIIKPFLIDFDKLEVGQKLWSVMHQNHVKINHKYKGGVYIKLEEGDTRFYDKNDKSLYHLFFTSNPFENLQRVEPLEAETTEERDIRCGKVSAKFDKKGTETLINRLEKRGYKVIKNEVEREIYVKYRDGEKWSKRKLLAVVKGFAICEFDNNHLGCWKHWKEIEEPSYDQLLKFWDENK